ncbi:MAG: hypothetical protein ACRDRZ_11140 [Pseudonocardiaceae bacterium]
MDGVEMGQAGTSNGTPVVIDLGAKATRQVLPAMLVCLAIGGITIYSVITGQVSGGRTAAAVLGALLLGLGVLMLACWRVIVRPRRLVLDPAGVHLDDPRGMPFSVRWDELAAAVLSRRIRRSRRFPFIRRVSVRMDLFPADPAFARRHPGMAKLARDGDRYRLPLGHAPKELQVIEQAVLRFRSAVWGGIRDE